ncbi:wiskott-Aldrich syndrome protein homolog 1-like [Triticum urartu]|uniref:wiskott-Aldrich syndrome protein homolog 1-like n=1 Tax=Triticum urartu TaxID=4572 RepID=UPI002044470A|nr:wiskott-Aldrich syndrome protein homolog 1-like [Triticum urartu]
MTSIGYYDKDRAILADDKSHLRPTGSGKTLSSVPGFGTTTPIPPAPAAAPAPGFGRCPCSCLPWLRPPPRSHLPWLRPLPRSRSPGSGRRPAPVSPGSGRRPAPVSRGSGRRPAPVSLGFGRRPAPVSLGSGHRPTLVYTRFSCHLVPISSTTPSLSSLPPQSTTRCHYSSSIALCLLSSRSIQTQPPCRSSPPPKPIHLAPFVQLPTRSLGLVNCKICSSSVQLLPPPPVTQKRVACRPPRAWPHDPAFLVSLFYVTMVVTLEKKCVLRYKS